MTQPDTSPMVPTCPDRPQKKTLARYQIVTDAYRNQLTLRQLTDRISAAEGNPKFGVTNTRKFLARHYGKTWPWSERKIEGTTPLKVKPSTRRKELLLRMSAAGHSKQDVMDAINVNEIALHRFLHRHFGSAVWPIGGKRETVRKQPFVVGGQAALMERLTGDGTLQMLVGQGLAIVPMDMTDRLLAAYVQTLVDEGHSIESVVETLADVRTCWNKMTQVCARINATAGK